MTAFVHVVDCREPAAAEPGVDCSGARAGKLYLQYWFYYVDSATLEGEGLQKQAMAELGRPGFHPDDWESYQVRIGPQGAEARAGSHHGYNYEGGARNWASDAGTTRASTRRSRTSACARTAAGAPETGTTWVSGGSHAGHVKDDPAARLVQGDYQRWTDARGPDPGPARADRSRGRRRRVRDRRAVAQGGLARREFDSG